MVNKKYSDGTNWDIRTGKPSNETNVFTRKYHLAWYDSRGQYLGYYSKNFNEFWSQEFINEILVK